MSKVKVNKELGKAIEGVLDWFHGDKERVLMAHGNKGNWTVEAHKSLNELNVYKLAEILINGYEVENQWYETKDEIIFSDSGTNLSIRCNNSSWEDYKKNGSAYGNPIWITVNKNTSLGFELDDMIKLRNYLTQKIDYLQNYPNKRFILLEERRVYK